MLAIKFTNSLKLKEILIMESIIINGIEFLPHTWPLVFGLPAFCVFASLAGLIYEIASRDE